MTKVKINRLDKAGETEIPAPAAPAAPRTATQEMTEGAYASHDVVDSEGRRITLQKPGLLAQFNLVKLVGSEAAENRVYMNMLLPITFVIAIDGVAVPAPQKQAHLDALIQRLGEHGLKACSDGLIKHWGATAQDTDQALDEVKE